MAYASKYYDPVKAHEYYLRRRQLKGRTKRGSTAGLSDEGKAIAEQVKEQIMAERKEVYNAISEAFKSQVKAIRERIKQAKKDGNQELIDQLKGDIEQLRADTKEKKAKVKELYQEKYYQEVDKLQAEYKAPKKGRKKKGKKSRKKRK